MAPFFLPAFTVADRKRVPICEGETMCIDRKLGLVAASAAAMVCAVSSAGAAPALMSAEWGRQACDAWNADNELTVGLAESGWVDNDEDRGFKVLQIYRTDCESSPRIELRIARQGDKAQCVYGGAVETADLDTGIDYIMHAETRRWEEMGAGKYGPMRAMMFGRLKFSGPKWEAMKNMGPFESFLRLAGQDKVPSDTSACP
jgi:putative sterol carrier protein